MEDITPSDLIPIDSAGKKTGKGVHFILVAAAQEKIDVFRAYSSGMFKCSPSIIEVFLNHGPEAYEPMNRFLKSTDSLYISESDAMIFSQLNKPANSATAIEKLTICDVEFPHSRQQHDGFKVWKKNVAEKFKTGVRAAVAVITYCHQQNEQLTLDGLQKLLSYPEHYEGAAALLKYKGKIPMDLIQDIYLELPPEFRHARGEKAK